uniref:Cytochrome P450, family 2, subfamily K, polypeptide 8 n=1 Tax=Callorhinchus milii TaxID=7868 RepID=A0A4W3IVZ0_CALMI
MTPHGKHRLREILTDKLFCSFVFAGECKTIKEKFMKCLRENKFDNSLCREVSKEYLECRMDRYKTKADLNLPPGPTPLPLIGNLHTLDLKMLYKSLMELSEKYGSVFTIHLGLERVVVLTGYKTVKEALVDQADEFAERAKIAVLEMQANEYGISFGHGESWKQMRRFALTTLRNFGMGKKTIEDKIIEETKFLVQEMESHKGQPFDTAVIVTSAMANIICSIVFGNRFDYKDEIFLTLTELVNENFRLLGSSSIQMYNAFPILGFLPGTHKKIFENRTQMVQLIMNFCKEHQKMLNENDIRSFIDAFLVKQREESKNPGCYFHDMNLVTSVTNLFAAGTDTSSSTLRWGILLMVKYPEIQGKVQEEIESVIGSERSPRMEDRKYMPYTDAVLHEIQRFANIIPMNIPHATTKDTHLRGYFIPKGTQVIPLLASVLYDKSQWEKPNEFNPSHFLDAEGRFVKKDAFMPFSAGQRICIGESLAKMELFLFFTTLMQTFTFHAPLGALLDLTPCVGLTLCPKPHQVYAVRR